MKQSYAWVLVFAAACGGGGNQGDDGDDTGADAALDGLRIVASTPADGGRGVRQLAALELTLSGPIDPATLTAGAVTLTAEAGLSLDSSTVEQPAPATVSWDPEALVLRVVPLEALEVKTRYRLALAGIANAEGDQLDAELRFETLWNTGLRAISYDDAGAITRYYQADPVDLDDPYAAGGTSYDSRGLDGTWFTADDRISSWYRLTRASATEYHTSYYLGPGPDTQWHTADDIFTYHVAYQLDAAGRVERRIDYTDLGPDGAAFTADDPVEAYSVTYRDELGRIIGDLSFTGPGADALWMTADDQSDYGRATWSFDAAGREVRLTFYDTPGTDGLWNTADDVIESSRVEGYDALGRREVYTSYGFPGPDGAWFTADDTISQYFPITRDADGQIIRTTQYSGPGTDATWHTADDRVNGYDAYGPFARDQYRTMIRYGDPGLDGVWFTADDESYDHQQQSFDADGVRVGTGYLDAPGPDGAYFTADDVRAYWTDYDATR